MSDTITPEILKELTKEQLLDVVRFIESGERMIGENTRGIESTTNRPLKDFIEKIYLPQMRMMGEQLVAYKTLGEAGKLSLPDTSTEVNKIVISSPEWDLNNADDYLDGKTYIVTPRRDVTGPTTFKEGLKPAYPIHLNGVPLTTGDMVSTKMYILRFEKDGSFVYGGPTHFSLQVIGDVSLSDNNLDPAIRKAIEVNTLIGQNISDDVNNLELQNNIWDALPNQINDYIDEEQTYMFFSKTANTGPMRLKVKGKPEYAIRKEGYQELVAGDVVADRMYMVKLSRLDIDGAITKYWSLITLGSELEMFEATVDAKIATAVSLLKGENLPESQDTLKELADMIIANANDLEEHPIVPAEELGIVAPALTRTELNNLISDWNADQDNVDKQNAIINANVSEITDMSELFGYKEDFNLDISGWDVSNVTNMHKMFNNATSFNQDISSWNVSSVTKMSYMFNKAEKFNQPIGNWNTSSVTDMSYMFGLTVDFNKPIGSWNTSSVTVIRGMFWSAKGFNQDISNWDVSNVKFMDGMFQSAIKFNQPIGSWNTSSVTDMSTMFQSATNFNQPIGSWNVSNVTDMTQMLAFTENFNQDISGWNVDNVNFYANFKTLSILTDANTPQKFI